MSRLKRGAQLPYRMLAGVVTCPGGWLLLQGRLQGTQLFPQVPLVAPRVLDILDYKPAHDIIAIHAPIGLLEEPRPGGRACEREARRLLGWPRSGSVIPAPTRPAALADSDAEARRLNGRMSPITAHLRSRVRELTEEMQPYWQRSVYEVHPELSFHQLNEGEPLKFSKYTEQGKEERRSLLRERWQGSEKVIDQQPPRGASRTHVIDALACLWTARRIAARSVMRCPEEPEWDAQGLRMEILR